MLLALHYVWQVNKRVKERVSTRAYMTESASKTRMNWPKWPHGERTCAMRPPVEPSSNAVTYAGSVMVMRAAPRIWTKQIGIQRPKEVSRNTRIGGISAGRRQL